MVLMTRDYMLGGAPSRFSPPSFVLTHTWMQCAQKLLAVLEIINSRAASLVLGASLNLGPLCLSR